MSECNKTIYCDYCFCQKAKYAYNGCLSCNPKLYYCVECHNNKYHYKDIQKEIKKYTSCNCIIDTIKEKPTFKFFKNKNKKYQCYLCEFKSLDMHLYSETHYKTKYDYNSLQLIFCNECLTNEENDETIEHLILEA